VKRGGGPASRRALAAAEEVLQGGELFGIYPEGTRTPDGRLYKGHTGVARLALGNRVPVLAVVCIGTREAQPIGQAVPRFFMPITIRISRPLDFSRYYDRADDPAVLRSVTDEIMYELRELSGQEYVHHYAKRRDDVGMAAEPTRVAAAVAG
jgi:1-acyl-sn-glycerol-3-phosphate acyltransferase